MRRLIGSSVGRKVSRKHCLNHCLTFVVTRSTRILKHVECSIGKFDIEP